MDRHGLLALGVLEDLHRIIRVRVQSTPHPPGPVRADGNQTQIERPAQLTDVLEVRAARQRVVFGAVVVLLRRHLRHSAVARVTAKPDGLAARLDGEGAPERGVLVPAGAG